MPLFRDPEREQQQKLEKFRRSFLQLTADGAYPPHRQQRLFLACQKVGLNWNEARQYIVPESVAFLRAVVTAIVADGRVTPQELAGLHRLQRRLGLTDTQATPLHEFYNLVERKIEAAIVERAAYLSATPLVQTLRAEIERYALPPERGARLVRTLERQHALAKLMAGELPIVMPTVSLYKDEICHLEMPATFVLAGIPAREMVGGRLLATSQRLMLLSSHGGFTTRWNQIQTLVFNAPFVQLRTPTVAGSLLCEDAQGVATLLVAACRRYSPAPAPEPVRPGRKLA